MIKIITGISNSDLETKLNAEMPADVLAFSGLSVILKKQDSGQAQESKISISKVFANGDTLQTETVLKTDGTEKSKTETAKDKNGTEKPAEKAGEEIKP